jgi:hypothetical protein
VLLVEGVVQSGVTQEFLMRNLLGRGAISVKLATLLDKHTERRVALQADYWGYAIEPSYVLGYGLGAPLLGEIYPTWPAPLSCQRRSAGSPDRANPRSVRWVGTGYFGHRGAQRLGT